MKINKTLLSGFFLTIIILVSCIEDDSLFPSKSISEITVEGISDTLNIDFGYELHLIPELTQSMGDLEMSYEWAYQGYEKGSIGGKNKGALEVISSEKELKYNFKNLGEYVIRLKVTNSHGSTYKYYTLFVNAPFSQGIFVLSSNENKKGRVSFMRPLSNEEIESGKEESFYTSAFTTVNPDLELNDPTDAVKIGPDIFILSRKDQLVYRIDAETFDLYNITELRSEFPWLEPLTIVSKDRSVTNYGILSENGELINVHYKSDIPFEASYFSNPLKVDKVYSKETGAPIPPSTTISRMRSNQFFLNYASSTVSYIYDIYGYYAFRKEFPNINLINIVMDESTMLSIIGRSRLNPNEIIILRGFCNNRGLLSSESEYKYLEEELNLTRESTMQSNRTYNSIFYNNANKLYRWYNWISDPVLPKTPIIKLNDNLEITCFDFSQNYRDLYLGVYDHSAPGLKGSVYIYDADEIDPTNNQLKLKKKFEGVSDRPIKVFWKNNRK